MDDLRSPMQKAMDRLHDGGTVDTGPVRQHFAGVGFGAGHTEEPLRFGGSPTRSSASPLIDKDSLA